MWPEAAAGAGVNRNVRPLCDPLARGGERVPDRSREDRLNLDIMDALSELIKRAGALGQGIAQLLGLSVSDLVGLHKLEGPLTMKELGQRLHCDPSFVTMIANDLEKRGLARRETSERDRRIKSVVLTSEGAAMREQLEMEFCTRAPWAYVLDVGERECLLGILRKLLAGFDSGQAMSGCKEMSETATGETATTGGDQVVT
jgi:MarR family transcriptional regulator, organic hydroperoxide resistance regulator